MSDARGPVHLHQCPAGAGRLPTAISSRWLPRQRRCTAVQCSRDSRALQEPCCRRQWLGSILMAGVAVAGSPALPAWAQPEYASDSQHYRVRPPDGWEQTTKQGADVLFQSPEEKGTNLGITVTPVRIASLEKFGTLDKVAERLLGVERGKESTKSIDMVHQAERTTNGTLFYDFDYVIDTTRGTKRIMSTVAVAGRKLYIAQGTIKCGKGTCDGSEAVAQTLGTSLRSLTIT